MIMILRLCINSVAVQNRDEIQFFFASPIKKPKRFLKLIYSAISAGSLDYTLEILWLEQLFPNKEIGPIYLIVRHLFNSAAPKILIYTVLFPT